MDICIDTGDNFAKKAEISLKIDTKIITLPLFNRLMY